MNLTSCVPLKRCRTGRGSASKQTALAVFITVAPTVLPFGKATVGKEEKFSLVAFPPFFTDLISICSEFRRLLVENIYLVLTGRLSITDMDHQINCD